MTHYDETRNQADAMRVLADMIAKRVVECMAEAEAKKQAPGPLDSFGPMMTKMEVAAFFHVTVQTVGEWVRSGRLPAPVRMGRQVGYPKAAVERLLK